jgi:hypothetical protein
MPSSALDGRGGVVVEVGGRVEGYSPCVAGG